MRILLDECIDRRFAAELLGHYVKTVPQAGWAGVKNGELMRLAEQEFDVFVTVDRNLSYQQNLPRYGLAVTVLRSVSNRLADLAPFSQMMLEAVETAEAGSATVLSLDN